MNVAVVRAGFLTAVQDLGRAGYRGSGVSPGGALDAHALRVANLLVGNEEGAAGLELTLGTLRLCLADERLVAWCGGNFDVEAAGAKLPPGRPALLRSGDEVRLTAPAKGARAWLAISGGIDVPLVLGSRATDLRSGFGGLEGRALRDDDVLALYPPPAPAALLAARLRDSRIASWVAPSEWSSTSPRHPFLRVVRGADFARFGETARHALLHESFHVTADSDRMGVRLNRPSVVRRDHEELASEPVSPGTVQIPPDGNPIVLLGDCQTIGGYPKIAHVITVDLPAAAQLWPGDFVRFAEVPLVEAQRLLFQRDRDLAWFRAGLASKLE